MRILVTDGMDKQAMAKLRELGHEVVEQFYEPDQLGAALRDFDAVLPCCAKEMALLSEKIHFPGKHQRTQEK